MQVGKIIKLLGSFIFQTIGDQPFNSGLVHFLAILSINKEINRLRIADNYSYILARVVYYARVLAIEVLLLSVQRNEQGEAERKRFFYKRRHFLANGLYSLISTIISLLVYSKSITLNTSNIDSVQQSLDKKVLYLYSRPIVIKRFQRIVQEVVKKAERVLQEELIQTELEGRFSIPLDKIMDDITFTKRGVSFVSKLSNGLADGLDWMINQIQTSSKGRRMRTGGIQNIQLVRQYIRKVIKYLRLLLFSIYTTYRQLGRGTEITPIRYQNGFLQDCNIYIIDRRVVIITRYYKSQSL